MESVLKMQDTMLSTVVVILPKLKTKHNLRGGTSSDEWKGFKVLCPRVAHTVEWLEIHYRLPLDFNNLDSWLKELSKAVSQDREKIQVLAEQGFDLSALSIQDLETKKPEMIMQKMGRNNPLYNMAPSLYGPNWFSHRDAICRLSGLTEMPLDKQVPLATFKQSIDKLADEIFSLWKILRRLESEGRVGCFEEQWGRLHSKARDSWLQQFSQLHRCPNLAIYTLAQYSKESLDPGPFLSSLLNIEDLVQANVLPDLLKFRSTIHPKTFLFADSRFVALGYWHQLFPKMQAQGRISLFSGTVADEENSLYGIQFEPDTMKKPYLANPVLGYYQLRAQQKMYMFLVSCLSAQIEPSVDPAASTGRDNRSQPLSLLNLSALLQYGRPDHIDWGRLTNMSKASADEALDDLWQLRTNAEYWQMRFMGMERSTSHFLRSVFGRIDVLLAVDEKLRVCRNEHQVSFSDDLSAIRMPCGDTQVEGTIIMHSTFRSILNEMLASMQDNAWLRRETANRTLRYLFDLMAKDDLTIRLMGFDAVLRIIERELSDGSAQEAPPLPIAQALHDMSVVAACMQETSKHYNLICNFDDKYATLANNAVSEWQERERPWLFLVQGLLGRILKKGNELSKEARDEKIPLEHRHRKFWNTIDDCMRSWNDSNPSNPIVREILTQTPVPRAAAPISARTTIEARWGPQIAYSTPTATQKKKSRKRRKPSKASAPTYGDHLVHHS